MKKLILILFLAPLLVCGQEKDWTQEEQEILAVIEKQRQAWNNFDLEGFMEGYWKSEELRFYGANGVTSGWNNTLERYKKAYPSREHTGHLKFVINEVSKIQENAYYVMGEFHLERSVGDANGIFMILFRKIDGEWKIIADTSC